QRPFKEIAEIIGITESNAKVKTYRILEKLKKKIIQITKQGGRAPEM
ncbi:MAG: RNA polymerase sigma-70 factor (ECF subfamily), partial [Saprospiraceae bacterium]